MNPLAAPSLEVKLIAAAVAVASLLAGVLWLQHRERQIGAAQCEATYAKQDADSAREAQRIEQMHADHLQKIQDAKDRQLRAVGAQLADALVRLRNRPERLPEAARAACAGSTGRELSGADAAFLSRLAARADELRAALDACQQREQVKAREP